jgi:hypothetical protein
VKKLSLLIAFALGYVLGAQAGRERYEQIRGTVNKVKNDPRVQERTQHAVDVAKHQAPIVADKVTSAAGAAKEKMSGTSDSQPHHMAGPQGDLP